MLTEFQEGSIARRRLILRDALSILSLFFGTGVLFVVTLALFHSFSAQRASLAQYWSAQGADDLQANKPDDAVQALRTALSYAPGTRRYELLLAEALGQAGHTEESYQYFMSLWDAEPGNGPVNLELARLAARRHDRPAAINFYRAAIYGTWEGDGVSRRAEVRLELARYFLANNDLAGARLELLIAGGNAPDDYNRDLTLATLLQQAQDPADSWVYFQHAIALKPDDPAAYEAAGRLAFQSADYENAQRMLARARTLRDQSRTVTPTDFADRTMLEDATRILQLMPLPQLTPRERVDRLLADRAIAKKRFAACSAQFAAESPLPPALQSLDTTWLAAPGTANAAALLRDPTQQSAVQQLIDSTEIQTQKLCSPATGDDALLLRLATGPNPTSLPSQEKTAPAELPHD